MSFLNNLGDFLRTSPNDSEKGIVELAGAIMEGGLVAAQKVLRRGHQLEALRKLPRDSVASAVLSSGEWRAGLPARDGEGLALARDILIAKNQFPAVRTHPVFQDADPEALGAALAEVAQEARRQLVVETLKAVVAAANAHHVIPRAMVEDLLDKIDRSPRIFREGDLVYRMVRLA